LISKFVRLPFERRDPSSAKLKRYWLIWDAVLVGGLTSNAQTSSLQSPTPQEINDRNVVARLRTSDQLRVQICSTCGFCLSRQRLLTFFEELCEPEELRP
jgi:hypothetical protein